MGCWFRKGCVSVGIWLAIVFVLGRPDTTWALPAVMVGLGSVLGCVGCGFMNWARGSKPEFKSCVESRDEAETWTGGGATNGGLDCAIWGWICNCGATGPGPLQRDCCGLLTSLLEVFFFWCLGTSPVTQIICKIYQEHIRKTEKWQLQFLKISCRPLL